MFRTIVAGCNGRERGRGAVSLAHAIATATGARLLLVGVHHNPPLPFPSGYADQRHELERDLRAVRDELAPEAVIQIHADMSPAHALRHVARYEGADLVVVGSRHRRRRQHIAESDHAMQVLHGARCAVAVAPDPLAPRPELRRIGVGIDATHESTVALEMACDLARRTGARLQLVAVADDGASPWWGYLPTPVDEETIQEIVEQRETAVRALVDERLALCEDVDAEGDVVVGNPAGELILASEGLDLLVLGSRRWGPVKRLALGSTSERVIRHTACPVLVPRRDADTRPDERTDASDEVTVE
ncbi:MAG TPA: universal stress protein [Solirubrobacteraceae bacterium]|jgi:nucleotide-binding universal stress UspA family protein